MPFHTNPSSLLKTIAANAFSMFVCVCVKMRKIRIFFVGDFSILIGICFLDI